MARNAPRSAPLCSESVVESASRSGDVSGIAVFFISVIALFLAFLCLMLAGLSFINALGLSLAFQMLCVAVLLINAFRRFVIDEAHDGLFRSSASKSGISFESNIWKSFYFNGKKSSLARVGFASQVNDESCIIAEELAEEGYEVHLSSETDAILSSMEESPSEWEILIFDLDQCDDHGSAADDLLAFRSACRDIVIVLLSSDVSRDDLSVERMIVTDVTLRKPLSKRRLMIGLETAYENAAFRQGEDLGLKRTGHAGGSNS